MSQVAQERPELVPIHRLRIELIVKYSLVPPYHAKEGRGFHVRHVGRYNKALPWRHELTLPVCLGREHTLVEKENYGAGQQVHAQILSSDGHLSIYSTLGQSIDELLKGDSLCLDAQLPVV